nr:uncharacterized protein LOC123853169 [Mirounga angustirostris]
MSGELCVAQGGRRGLLGLERSPCLKTSLRAELLMVPVAHRTSGCGAGCGGRGTQASVQPPPGCSLPDHHPLQAALLVPVGAGWQPGFALSAAFSTPWSGEGQSLGGERSLRSENDRPAAFPLRCFPPPRVPGSFPESCHLHPASGGRSWACVRSGLPCAPPSTSSACPHSQLGARHSWAWGCRQAGRVLFSGSPTFQPPPDLQVLRFFFGILVFFFVSLFSFESGGSSTDVRGVQPLTSTHPSAAPAPSRRFQVSVRTERGSCPRPAGRMHQPGCAVSLPDKGRCGAGGSPGPARSFTCASPARWASTWGLRVRPQPGPDL